MNSPTSIYFNFYQVAITFKRNVYIMILSSIIKYLGRQKLKANLRNALVFDKC